MPNRFYFEIKSSFKIVEIVFTVAGLSLLCAPAEAGFQPVGFQWVAPPEQAAPPASAPTLNSAPLSPTEPPPPMMPAPAMPVTQTSSLPQAPSVAPTPLAGENPEIISPIVIEGQPLSSATPTTSVPGQNTSLGTLSPGSAPDALVQGFANNVPLAVALREVLPAGYGFSIDQDVDLGTLVSFQGGKPWRVTLQTMLEPAGLAMRERNEMVAISRATGNGAPPPDVAAANPSLAPAPLMAPTAVASVAPAWPGAAASGPRPMLTQPSVAMPPPPPAPPPVSSSRISSGSVVDTWTATRGETLHKVLEGWSHRAGAEFEWLAEYDYPLQASVSFTGTFEEAVRSLLSGFEEAHPEPVAALHANPGAGQMVLVVEQRGNSYTD